MNEGGVAVRLDGDHVLAFDGRPLRGEFTHTGWTVTGLGTDEIVKLMVSGHEAEHAALNSITVWGALMQAIAIASRLAPERARYAETLLVLVKRCRRTHEAYATHRSLVGILNADEDSTAAGLLAGFPTYQAHLDDAIAIGPVGAISLVWRQLAVEAALLACMQPRVLPLRTSLADFRPASFRESDSPDSRYLLLRSLAPRLWAEVDDMCAEVMGPQWNELRRVEAPRRGVRAALPAQVQNEIYRLCVLAASVVLKQHGQETTTLDEVQSATLGIVGALSEVLGGVPNPMVVDGNQRAGLAQLYELERIELRPPRKVTVHAASTAGLTDLVSGQEPDRHVLVVARRASVLRRQFSLDVDPWGPEDTVCAVQVARTGPDGGRTIALYPMAHPDELLRLRQASTDHGVLASVAVSSSRDGGWREVWLPALHRSTRLTMLLDFPFLPSIDALAAVDPGVRYAVARIRVDDDAYSLFACRIADEPPLFGLCSLVAGLAFADHVANATNGRAVETLDALGVERDHIPLIVRHLVLDESYIETAS
jgi:hypothetical protein